MAKFSPGSGAQGVSASMTRVGPYQLDAPVGRGGMARVWRAHHVRTGDAVALKVMQPRQMEAPVAREAFRSEVRAQARLDHPGIVRVHDQGVVREDEATGELAAGRPWLAMDLAPLGSLDAWVEPLAWSGVRGVLLAVLDALAHAHARQVVHRDLKLGNLLVFRRPTEAGGAPGVRISDFGVAHALRDDRGLLPHSGTPRVMAPEQFRGVLADQGPWTDLYAVGCLAWELVAGEPPFPVRDAAALRTAHLTHPPRPLPEDVSVPAAFPDWLDRCLAKGPEQRFRYAADAAHALVGLGDPPGTWRPRRRVASGAETLPVEQGPASTLAWALDDEAPPPAPPPLPELERGPVAPAPFPPHWRRPRLLRPPPTGTGLGLFGLQTPPLVGRAAVRDGAWAALGMVRQSGRPAAVIIDGPPGVGKSRIADWVGERFHEVGGGPVARVSCAHGTADAALERLVARQLGIDPARPDTAWARTQEMVRRLGLDSSRDAEAVGRLLHVGPHADAGFGTAEARWTVVARLLGRLADDRALLVIADDAHWSPDLLGFARWLLARGGTERCAVAFVFTVRSDIDTTETDAPGDRSTSSVSGLHGSAASRRTGAALETLGQERRCAVEHVEPLTPGEHAALVRSLGVSPSLAAQIAERTAGNPMFAVQLVGDLVRGRQVVGTPQGLALRGGGAAALPPDLGAVWSARIRRLVRGRPAGDGDALLLAALLGVEVDRATWVASCAHAGLAVPVGLVEELVAERLWLPRPWGWLFAHALMREGLLRRLDEETARRLHRACAEALSSEVGGHATRRERLGRHLLAAGDAGEAVAPLLDGARSRFARGELDAALAVLRRVRRALDRAAAGAGDARHAEVALLEGQVLQARGRSRPALDAARRARRLAGRHVGVQAAATLLEGRVVRQLGELLRARELLREALELASASGDDALTGDALLALGRVALRQGRFEEAGRRAVEALARAEAVWPGSQVASALRTLADIRRQEGDVDGAVDHAEQALALSRAGADRLGEAAAIVALGRAAESGDEPGVALGFFQQAAELYDGLDAPAGHVARLQAARVLVDLEAWDEARELLDACGAAFAALGRRGRLGAVDVVRLSVDAHERDWTAWRMHVRRASRLLVSTGLVDPDLGVALEHAAELALDADAPDRAAEALDLAATLWAALGDDARAAACRGALGADSLG